MFWTIGFGFLLVYCALFLLAKRPVALRMDRLGWLVVVLVVARIIVLCFREDIQREIQYAIDPAAAVLALLFLLFRGQAARVWLIRGSREDFKEHILTACRGLLLPVEEETPGRLLLKPKGACATFHVLRVSGRLTAVRLPPGKTHVKITLLRQWASKQYPGPIPRLSFRLKRK